MQATLDSAPNRRRWEPRKARRSLVDKARVVILAVAIVLLLGTFLFPYTEYYVDAGSRGPSGGFMHISIAPRKGFIPIWKRRYGASITHVQWPVVLGQAGGIVIVFGVAFAFAGKKKRAELELEGGVSE
jgi:hypothetical protein